MPNPTPPARPRDLSRDPGRAPRRAPDATVFDAQVDEEGILILGDLQQADGSCRMRVTRYAPGTGRPTAEYRIADVGAVASGSFVASDSDATVVLHAYIFGDSISVRNVVYTLGDGGFEPILELSTTGSWGLGARTGGLLAFYASFTASPDAPALRVWRDHSSARVRTAAAS